MAGIIAMLLSSGARKIHVCAPSNAAVDEILTRLSEKNLMGLIKDPAHLKKMLLRIGAIEYEPSETVKRHTLDSRLAETLNDAKVYKLKEEIGCCDDLLMEIAKGFPLDATNRRHC